jgi:rare lipoprotein A (peptidoglycan hydrolase)
MRSSFLFLATSLLFASPACAETGLASWYGWREHGRVVASGKPFNALGDNAASRHYPLGTHLLITNLANGRHAEIVIQDRGPYIRPRILDVSLGTARILGFERKGLAMVQIEPVTPIVRPATFTYRVRPVPHHARRHRRGTR